MQLRQQWEGRRRAREERFNFELKRGLFAQHDQNIGNASGASVRADINNALAAAFSLSSGNSAPGTTVAYMLWADTTTNLLKQRNAANSAWIVRGTLAETFVIARSSDTVYAASDLGKTFICTSTFTQTFPAVSGLFDGWWVRVKNNGTGVITFDPNSAEQIDGGTTIALAPGEGCVIVCDGSAFHTVGRKSPGQWDLINTYTPSAAAAQAITGFNSALYSDYKIVLDKVQPATDAQELYLRTSTDGGANYDSGAADYGWVVTVNSTTSTDASDSEIALTGTTLGTGSGESCSGEIFILNPGAAARCYIQWKLGGITSAPGFFVSDGQGQRLAAADVDAVQLLFASGNIASGTIRLYGLRKPG